MILLAYVHLSVTAKHICLFVTVWWHHAFVSAASLSLSVIRRDTGDYICPGCPQASTPAAHTHTHTKINSVRAVRRCTYCIIFRKWLGGVRSKSATGKHSSLHSPSGLEGPTASSCLTQAAFMAPKGPIKNCCGTTSFKVFHHKGRRFLMKFVLDFQTDTSSPCTRKDSWKHDLM